MSDPQECPVEGCDYEGEIEGLRSHVSNTKDPSHDYSELKDVLEEGEEVGDEGGDPSQEGGGDPSEILTDDGSTESIDDDATDPSQEGDSDPTEMVTDEELDRQRERTDTGSENDAESLPTKVEKSDTGGSGIPIPVSSTTVMLGSGLILIFGLLYLYIRSSGDTSPDETLPDDEATDEDVRDAAGEGEVTLFDD